MGEHADVIREARLALEDSEIRDYVSVLPDVIQDFRTADLKLLRALVLKGSNDIFVVGDLHQRIYGHKASLSRCGISVRGRRSRKLRINYRTTQEIRGWAVARLKGLEIDDLDEGKDTLAGERSPRSGDAPSVEMFADVNGESGRIATLVRQWQEEEDVRPEDICMVARTKALIEQSYGPALQSHGLSTTTIDTESSDRLGAGVRLASMYRVKVLEFPRMVLAVRRDRQGALRRRGAQAPVCRGHSGAGRAWW